jgi:RNA methyltransferase, TrmH family
LALRNEAVQRLRRLAERRSSRWEERSFVVEGPKLLAGALDAGAEVQAVYLDAAESTKSHRALVSRGAESGAKVYELQPGVLARVCDTVTPQPVAAVVSMVDRPLAELNPTATSGGALAVFCVEIQDPGNAGTVLRSAAASGAGAVIFSARSVDVYNPKVVRASAGALFKVPVVTAEVTSEDVLDELGRLGMRRLGTIPHGGCDYTDMDLTGRTVLVLGNESRGLMPALTPRLDGFVSIPMSGGAESLNVAMTASILCFEAARQRRARAAGSGDQPGRIGAP